MQLEKSEFQKHLKENLTKVETKPHEDILQALLDSMEKVDFMIKAFPELKKLQGKINALIDFLEKQPNKETDECKAKREEMKDLNDKIDSMKLKEKHYLVISVEEILKKAKFQKLGLCLNGNFVYLYNGEYWKSIEQKTFENFLGEASQVLGIEKFTAKYFNFRERLYKQFTASGYLPTPPKPKNKVLINLKNGTFEISEKPNLRAFVPTDFMRYQLPFAYNEKATAPKFEAYLNRVLPEKDKQEVLCEYLGYIFIPTERLKLEKALFLYGGGANGKSVLYDIIRALLGDQNTSEYSLQSLTDVSGYSRAQIADKLVNYATEINGRLESSKFKALASGEPMEARLPYRDPFIIENYAKLIFNANELPKEVEFTHGFFRRFLIIPFEVTIPENEQNKGLAKEIIQEELPGVFNWVLTGLKRLLVNGKFSQSPSIDNALEDFKTESDTVKRFLQENGFTPDYEKKILLKDLYPQYREFALEDGNKPLSKSNFKKRLEANKIFVNRESEGLQVYVLQKDSENGNLTF
ncbi:phage/plasmid primase, P4 family [Algoriphagus aquimarinus]|uniref:DNA primase n=1 Tax=Algoriphagus aquimarinus TaxID=237018 RepID=A0A5C7ALX0_9BACT|nr:DNA primase family protein [Algoriphagus aquimarinus]TXE07565.1 DNA primase [Algoriphagus aquimarinus]